MKPMTMVELPTMKVLDIDLDLFVDPRPGRQARSTRLSAADYQSWTTQSVEQYLVDRCNLRKNHPLPGAIVTYHHELFDVWKALIAAGRLRKPFQITHLDSHADMGMGDGSCGYILGELLSHDVADRENPKQGGVDGLLEGNFLSFCLACRWISSVVYVHHPRLFTENCNLHDIPNCLFQNNQPRCNVLQLKRLPPECRNPIYRLTDFTPISLEPEVPIQFTDRDKFQATDSYSFIFVAHSPKYTPVSADPILEVIRQFIRLETETEQQSG